MISIQDILTLHFSSIKDYGGAHGLRDEEALLSAVARPYQTFDGKELYNTPIEKAAAISESLIVNHPFVDGNKRIGLLAMLRVLYEDDVALNVSDNDLYDLIISISTGEKRFPEIVHWLKQKTSQSH